MIGLDANVIVRYLVADDPEQSAAARACMFGLTVDQPGFIADTVIVEVYWVLARSYGRKPVEIVEKLRAIAESPRIRLQSPRAASAAVEAVGRGADFADAMIGEVCVSNGCTTVVSFDRGANATLGWTLL